MVVLKTVPNLVEAQVMVCDLRSQGIEARFQSEPQMYPPEVDLVAIQIFVNESQIKKANEYIEQKEMTSFKSKTANDQNDNS